MAHALEARARSFLAPAGIELNGGHDCDLTVHNPGFFARVLRHGSLGLGESYMDGWWDCPRLDELFCRIFAAKLDRMASRNLRGLALTAVSALFNQQTKSKSPQVARRHYDAGNELFQQMLDRRMVYTTGLWENAGDLNQAQEAKLDFVCRKLELQPGMRVLDIGCGWGSFAKFAAEKYGVRVDGVTLSQQQAALGQSLCKGLPVALRVQDYRDITERYDRVVSLGMFEHVGHKNYRQYFETAHRCLAPGGRMYLATIGSNHTVRSTDPWIERYIFPNSHLPSIQQIGAAVEDRFALVEWHNWAADYDRTLMAWHANFAAQWQRWVDSYSERFCRMWNFYLLSSAAAFRSRHLQVWQILLDPL
ncbi:MAG: cyclopropane fatty acyl phospholipid synthase [Terriglobales bacterium]